MLNKQYNKESLNHSNSNLKEERIPISRKSFSEKNGSFKISVQDSSEAMPSTRVAITNFKWLIRPNMILEFYTVCSFELLIKHNWKSKLTILLSLIHAKAIVAIRFIKNYVLYK